MKVLNNKSSMKVVIATAVYYPQVNGVAVFSHNLAVGLSKRGVDTLVICPSQTGKNYTRTIDRVKTVYLKSVQAKIYPDQIHPLPKQKKVMGLKVPRLFYRHGFRVSIFPQHEIKKVLDTFKPDVVHVQVSDPIGLSVVSYARKHDIPVVSTEHNQPEVLTSSFKLPGVMKKPFNALLYSYFRNRQSKSDFVTMPTQQAIDNLLNGHDLGVPVAAISNGVDLSSFRPGKAPEAVYRKYGISRNKKIVLYVGRIDPEKRVEIVIKAFGNALRRGIDAELVIVGDGVDKNRLEQLVLCEEYSDSIKFLGRVLPPDLYELYKTGDVFVTASEIETQGIVLIEAAAAGLPLVAVDKGAVREVCIDNKNGFLCRPRDVEQMGEAIVQIIMDKELHKQFSEESLRIAKEHDFETTLDRFLNIYKHVLRTHSGNISREEHNSSLD